MASLCILYRIEENRIEYIFSVIVSKTMKAALRMTAQKKYKIAINIKIQNSPEIKYNKK